MQTWNSYLTEILTQIRTPDLAADPHARLITEAYLVPSPDRQDLQFSFPVLIHTNIGDDISLPRSGSAGGIHAIIEYCKEQAVRNPELGLLYGAETVNQSRYQVNLEPYTIVSSQSCIATGLWHPDEQNYVDEQGIHLILRGALRHHEPSQAGIPEMAAKLSAYAQAIADQVHRVPLSRIRKEWETTVDQQTILNRLPDLGLVSFIGDGTRPAREFTRYRCWERVAGPKRGVHIPFYTPKELDPIEVFLPGSNQTITGLGIRAGELFAITGSNAQGKTSLLQAIHAGEDIHAPGDGREHLVTVRGGISVDATNVELKGVDLTPFFETLPPGMGGDPGCATGQGSGSASMAFRIKDAIVKRRPYIIIDEDRSAQNLVHPCYMSVEGQVHSLASLLYRDRSWLEGTGLIIAGSGMELLIARADRIIRLCDHAAVPVSKDEWREGLRRYYQHLIELV
ncbi:MAG: ABC-ATPase domain-containing protein [Methanospirillum sp.]|uniref:P-loop domain-containing protein n=1 Tax=Methanospirillum sp. TaxID=45200 RepID=UPI002370E4DE|nr:P-loop domain-containing protein [Methanospirillum sp.]MDD1728952.1 ABC-ATPase domain-containing protein [Methanospirillum sp.]